MSARIVLVGLGAIGAAYASRLVDAGCDLRVLLDAGRSGRYAGRPTVVNGRAYDFPLSTGADGPADLAVVAVKRAALEEAIELLRPCVTDRTVVLSLLNGIDSEEVLARAFPAATVLLAVSVGIDAVRNGRDVRFTSLGRILLGEPVNPGPRSAQVAAVAALLDHAGIDCAVPSDMVHQLWWKWLINVGVNQVSALCRVPYRVLQNPASPARAVMIAAQREVIAVANARGVALDEHDLDRWLEVLAGLGPDNYTSMAQDVLAGRPTEVDSFAGTVVALGGDLGVPVPVNAVLYGLLKGAEAADRSS
ncbi:ketopantoate reductase family protein [Propionicimonas sp.]|uniref:ketopantoate reductase family protein n=1 Tax=Propionicimonas sp. TaxID=1955623 RepID=UPI0039E25BCB